MILDKSQIKDIILNNPNKDLVEAGRRYNKTLRLHLYGEGLAQHLTTIDGFETPAIRELRVKYAKNNKDVMARLKRPIDKVYSARGGSIYINLSEGLDKQAMDLVSSKSLKGRKSLKEWIKDVWTAHYLDDPFGLSFVELDAEGNIYPTYKAISGIYDYLPDGVNLEYVVFEVSKLDKVKYGMKEDEKVYRVYDDAWDYIVKQEGEDVVILKNLSFPNFFGYVPGMINSDITNPEKDGYLSIFDDVITLADEYLLTGSIRTTHKFLHGFPKYWEYADDCYTCGTTGFLEGKTCPDCKGTKKRIMTKVSDAKLLSYPQTNQDAVITPNVAGYVEPSEIFHNISTSELAALEDAMNFTIWGKSTEKQTPQVGVEGAGDNKTATQILGEVKPEESRLTPISESAEKRHKFILDSIVEVSLRQGYVEGGGSSVNYGRRYMLETSDVILAKYNDAKLKGASVSVLDDLLIDYLETEYSGDPVKMAIKLKEMALEPFVHMKVAEVDASANITAEDKAAKVYYSEWRRTVNDAMLLSFTPEMLKEQLYQYAAEKAAKVQEAADKQMEKEAASKQQFKPAA
jgi:hypothetical protein